MKRPRVRPARLAAALAALATGILLTHLPAGVPRPASPCEGRSEAKEAPAQAEPAGAVAPRERVPRVAQREVLSLPGVGLVRVTAYETGEDTRLVFEDAYSGKELLSCEMADDSLNPSLRFKAVHVEGLPDPTIVAVAVSPGGSGSTYEMAAFASHDRGLRELTRTDAFTTSEVGGFYLGDLGRGLGPGLATWDAVEDYDNEGRHDPHRYEIKLYRWDEVYGRFEWERVFRTRGKFDSDGPALRAEGLRLRDVREGAPEFAEVYEPR